MNCCCCCKHCRRGRWPATTRRSVVAGLAHRLDEAPDCRAVPESTRAIVVVAAFVASSSLPCNGAVVVSWVRLYIEELVVADTDTDADNNTVVLPEADHNNSAVVLPQWIRTGSIPPRAEETPLRPELVVPCQD